MAVKLTCDVCHKEFDKLGKVDALTDEYQVPGRIEHLCMGCIRKLTDKAKSLREHYAKLLSQDIRTWLLDLENKSNSKILTS